MICAKGHSVPDNALCCPHCTAVNGDHGLHETQAEYLRRVASGQWPLRIGKGHLILFGSFTRTFCGQELPAKGKLNYRSYGDEQTLAKVCGGCRSRFNSMIAEVR